MRFTGGLQCAVWAAEVTCSPSIAANSSTYLGLAKKNLGAFDKVTYLTGNIWGALMTI